MRRFIATTIATLAIAIAAAIAGYIVGNNSTTIIESTSPNAAIILVTLESTPSNPLTLINTGRIDSNGIQAEYYCSNNDTTIEYITSYKILRNNSHYVISDRIAPLGTMTNLISGDIPSTCSGWTGSN